MSKEVVKGVPIGNLLYTTEGAESAHKTKAELTQPDPTPERALGVLSGNKAKDKDTDQDEQAAS